MRVNKWKILRQHSLIRAMINLYLKQVRITQRSARIWLKRRNGMKTFGRQQFSYLGFSA